MVCPSGSSEFDTLGGTDVRINLSSAMASPFFRSWKSII